MRNLLKLEEAALFALAVFAYAGMGLPWWWFVALLFAPDLSAIGYLAGPRVGAIAYNLFHHRALAVLLFTLSVPMDSLPLRVAGIIIFAHASLDRVFGYGLKYPDSFHNTHLGPIGRGRQP
ncbi:MAG TPA: DUF4260 domain-containing protein [Anaerolineales bacterium]|nr:DUF4260 domain-containing protein [Anaerolineales bacterium]HRQ91626.1 DUF4260 domain-containing protein [Anaerolineales bacterium]